MTLREDLMFQVNMPIGFSTPVSRPAISTMAQNLEWKVHVFDDLPVAVSASQISIPKAAAAYTEDMTGAAWDVFMNKPGAVAIRQQQAMFMEMRDQFYAEYEGKYVAFSDGEILDSDPDDSALLVRTRELRRQRAVLVTRVQREYPPADL